MQSPVMYKMNPGPMITKSALATIHRWDPSLYRNIPMYTRKTPTTINTEPIKAQFIKDLPTRNYKWSNNHH